MSKHVIEQKEFGNGIIGQLYHDEDAEFEEDLGVITYNSLSRYVLGTTPVDGGRDEEIAKQIESGELIGMKVYAYVHGGSTIRTTPFGDPWDSGRSGWVYCTKEQAIKEWGEGGAEMTDKVKEQALSYLEGVVKHYDDFLQGDVYYYLIEDRDGDVIDSLSGMWGREYAEKEMEEAGKRCAKESQSAPKQKV